MPLQWNRRTILAAGIGGVSSVVLARAAELPQYTRATGPYVEVETALGRVRGGNSRGALVFKGIPYAGPVSGKCRFKAPPAPTPWKGVREALRLGSPAMQGPGTVYGEDEPPYSEECLVLNVWTPAADGSKRPVMFYCHGGGFTTGSAGARGQDGARLAAAYDVVVVACNHRLGLLGYLYLGELGGEEYATSGNQGMLDIVAALRWVRDNIAAFGGDPANVMVFGESGGGFKTGTLLAMPSARGLFDKASIESGAALRRMSKDAATETALRVLYGLGLSRTELRKLADIPAGVFVAMQADAQNGSGALAMPSDPSQVAKPRSGMLRRAGDLYEPGTWGPVVDGVVLPSHPFDPVAPAIAADIPIVVGHNRDEAIFFNMGRPQTFVMDSAALSARMRVEFGSNAEKILSVYRRARPASAPAELYIAIASAQWFGNDATELADSKAIQPAPVFRYRYDYASNFVIPGTSYRLGAGHASEIAMKFFNWDMPGLHGNGPGLADASRNMSAFWTSFARTGQPSAPGQPAWVRYDTTRRATMLIDTQCRLADDPDAGERRLWQALD